MSIFLLITLVPASSFAEDSTQITEEVSGKAILSDMTESEAVSFVIDQGISIPALYEDELCWGPFIKKIIAMVEIDPDCQFGISYSVTAAFAEEIRTAVIAYYGLSTMSNSIGIATISTVQDLVQKDALDYSTVYGEWDDQYAYYNCYSYVLGYTTRFIEPGLFTAVNPETYELDLSLDMWDIYLLIKDDLEFLGHQRIRYQVNSMSTANLCTNERIICVRKGPTDYHFMKYTNGMWLHKPGNTHVLQYNIVPTPTVPWYNEIAFDGKIYAHNTTYDSEIYFISYNGHDWECTANSGSTHTKACSICGDEFTESCDWTYSSNADGTHAKTCRDCDQTSTVSCSYTYIYDGSDYHRKECSTCGYVKSTSICSFTYEGNDDGIHVKSCTLCSNSSEASCTVSHSYCGSDTLGNVHKEVCLYCGDTLSSATEACTMGYVYAGQVDGSNTHKYACTVCGYSELGAVACTYKNSDCCFFCGIHKDAIMQTRVKAVQIDE